MSWHAPHRRRDDERGTPLNARQVAVARGMLRQPYVRTCVGEIEKSLMGGSGIVLQRNGVPVEAPVALQRYIDTHLNPFARNAFYAMLTLGIVPIAFLERERDGSRKRTRSGTLYQDDDGDMREYVPYVPDAGTYRIYVRAVRGKRIYAFYWINGQGSGSRGARASAASYAFNGSSTGGGGGEELDTSVYVASDFGFDPDLNGQLNSLLYTVSLELAKVGELTRHMLRAERVLAGPPLITEMNPAFERRQDTSHTDAFYAGRATDCEDRAETLFARTAEDTALVQQAMRQQAATLGMDSELLYGVDPTAGEHEAPMRFAPGHTLSHEGWVMPWSNHLEVPSNRRVVPLQLPSARSDYVALVNQSLEAVYSTLGVPLSLLSGGGTKVRASAQNAAADMDRTVRQWATTLGRLVTLVYEASVGIVELRRELGERLRLARVQLGPRSSAVPSDRLLPAHEYARIGASRSLRFTFDLPPLGTFEELGDAYSRGLFSWNTFRRYTHRVLGVDVADAESMHDAWSVDERKQLLLRQAPGATAAAAGGATPAPASSSRARKRNDDDGDDSDGGSRKSKKTTSKHTTAKRRKTTTDNDDDTGGR